MIIFQDPRGLMPRDPGSFMKPVELGCFSVGHVLVDGIGIAGLLGKSVLLFATEILDLVKACICDSASDPRMPYNAPGYKTTQHPQVLSFQEHAPW